MFHMSREIYNKIEELAHLITESDEYKAMKQAEKESESDPALSARLAAYNEKKEQIEIEADKEERDFDLLAALTREADEISMEMYALPAWKTLQQARIPFNQLMQGVVDVLQSVVEPDVQCSCSRNCASCGGCGQA
ncbi:MAG: YlbF family regulator [Clostridia bacterium]|nr:YlbF family regulator [Clostridia bacterium]